MNQPSDKPDETPPFSLRHLQEHLPWTIPYSDEFHKSAGVNAQRRIGHDVLHVLKSLGRIAADVEAADHQRPRKLQGETLAKEVADLVICALHIARLEGFDLQDAVVKNSEARNAASVPVEWTRLGPKSEVLPELQPTAAPDMRVPGWELVEPARINAEYWQNASRATDDGAEAVLAMEQAHNAYKNCAYALAEKLSRVPSAIGTTSKEKA